MPEPGGYLRPERPVSLEKHELGVLDNLEYLKHSGSRV
jgi:hypothetical protein